MTITLSSTESATMQRLQPVAFDLYRDIHKGIRSELFAAVGDAGRLDPSDDCGTRRSPTRCGERCSCSSIMPSTKTVSSSRHSSCTRRRWPSGWRPITTRSRPGWTGLSSWRAKRAPPARGRALLHELYVELASFTGAYLLHQDVEEREVGQALESALGVDGVVGLHMAIIANMPPQQLVGGLAVMFPAMNVDDRTDVLGGMRATAPAEAFAGVWSLAKSVLSVDDHRAVAVRLGLA